MNIKWNEYTWYSKLAAIVFFIALLPIWTFFMGVRYENTQDVISQGGVVNNPDTQSITIISSTSMTSHLEDTYSSPACTKAHQTGITSDLVTCTAEEYSYRDSQLNSIYQKILDAANRGISTNDGTSKYLASLKDSLKTAETHWISYRDAMCKSVITADTDGSISSVDYNSCLSELTHEQTVKLQKIYDSWWK